jgi:hypothetical protein
MLPSKLDAAVTDAEEALNAPGTWAPKGSTSVGLATPAPSQYDPQSGPGGEYTVALHETAALHTRDFAVELAGLIAEMVQPDRWSSPPIFGVGEGVPIPPYARVLIVQNPTPGELNLTVGQLQHVVPSNVTATYPVLAANQFTAEAGLVVTMSSDYRDALAVSGAL